MIKTEMGLPFVLRCTCSKLLRELKEIDLSASERYAHKLFNNINDPVYKKFIENCSELYSAQKEVKKIAKYSLVFCYEVLRREGELPKLDKRKIETRWKKAMTRDYDKIINNVRLNKDKICDDNPIYGEFIIFFTNLFPETKNSDKLERIIKSGTPSDRLFILSDLLYGYMFLADSLK